MGKCFKSSPPIPVTEQETEYMVVCTKHIFAHHIVFQFNCTNTIENTCLENTQMLMETADDGFEEHETVPCSTEMMCGAPGDNFVSYAFDETHPNGTFACTLKFVAKDVDESTGEPDNEGYEDEYQVEEVEVTAADYVRPQPVPDFRNTWTSMVEPFEVREQFTLDAGNLQDGVSGVVEKVGLAPCEGTHRVAEGTEQHDLLMSGLGMAGSQVLVRCSFRCAPSRGCQMRMLVRSADGELAAGIAGLFP
jgi:coatomer protein complex subunit gamma